MLSPVLIVAQLFTPRNTEKEKNNNNKKKNHARQFPKSAISTLKTLLLALPLYTRKQEKKVCPSRNCGQIPLEFKKKEKQKNKTGMSWMPTSTHSHILLLLAKRFLSIKNSFPFKSSAQMLRVNQHWAAAYSSWCLCITLGTQVAPNCSVIRNQRNALYLSLIQRDTGGVCVCVCVSWCGSHPVLHTRNYHWPCNEHHTPNVANLGTGLLHLLKWHKAERLRDGHPSPTDLLSVELCGPYPRL